MKEIGLRFMGDIPKGRFEFSCLCGNWSGVDLTLSGVHESYSCKECGAEFRFVQQLRHWHLFITPRREIEKEEKRSGCHFSQLGFCPGDDNSSSDQACGRRRFSGRGGQ